MLILRSRASDLGQVCQLRQEKGTVALRSRFKTENAGEMLEDSLMPYESLF